MIALTDPGIASWRWRFDENLYFIKPADDRDSIRFAPRPEQWEILELIYDHGNLRLAILKSRQLGFSTLLALICLDLLLFRPGCRIGIVDQTADHAKKKRAKIEFAWSLLPPSLVSLYEVSVDTKSEFSIQLQASDDRRRDLYAGMNPRGDTHDFLWISEWGPIQVEDAHRSDKIADGGLPSVEKGVCVVETTWRGGKAGRLWSEVVDPALKVAREHRTLRDWQVQFYPWHLDPELSWEGSAVQITDDCLKYFEEVEKQAIDEAQRFDFEFTGFSPGQRLWYFKVAWPKRLKRYEEYPTTMGEMFLNPEPGAIFPEEMATMRSQGRLTRLPIQKSLKTIVSFDLGRDDAMPCVFIQMIGNEIRCVDYYTNNRELVDHYVSYIASWCKLHGVGSVQIVLPHDSKHKGILVDETICDKFERLGRDLPIFWEVTTVGVIPNIWTGIDFVRDIMPYMSIDASRCGESIAQGQQTFPSLVECLDHYHAIEIRDGRNISRDVIHDRYCHGADALRTFAEGFQKGLIRKAGNRARSPRVISGSGSIGAEGEARTVRVRS